MWAAINSLASRLINVVNENTVINNSTNENRNVTIGGNVMSSTIHLSAISGSVSTTVSQLPSSPNPAQPGVKELLVELQIAIENDTELLEKGKATALEQFKVLAEVAQNRQQTEQKNLGSQAITFLKGAASILPDTAKSAEVCNNLLPLITKSLDLPS